MTKEFKKFANPNKRSCVHICMRDEVLAEVENNRGAIPRSAYIDNIVENYVMRKDNATCKNGSLR